MHTLACGALVHRELLPAWQQLSAAAAAEGFELAVASGWRDPARQLQIWNRKACGQLAVLDENEQPLDLSRFSDWQQVQAILRWSALPGASRHHWGTELDIFDRAAVADDYQLQLTRAETTTGGPFASMHRWLDSYLADNPDCGFFRPYDKDRGGVSPEPWHLSYAPLACEYQAGLMLTRLQPYWQSLDLALKSAVLAHSETIFQRYIWVPASSYPSPYAQQLQTSGMELAARHDQ